ncbi:hypothetical protein THASP1DRAFT_30833 [Thamnocephalis sphaerospora]|uniref:DNA endonuclease activator Ctp1 C-terminal domain-containing protein n=1 Tax=Thamnocephalis sphaerospora TaxID=78915 RepID=A0A4P9XNF1_9FUNG|nr:hypothetical protein THASP1DRAFT_30833 [Thamnocephalis sphaerospora]|eukprot:RKP07352.1 hypothetical protein THASP1DRAFT_30833 [Thamnocephalis sphaerospora]
MAESPLEAWSAGQSLRSGQAALDRQPTNGETESTMSRWTASSSRLDEFTRALRTLEHAHQHLLNEQMLHFQAQHLEERRERRKAEEQVQQLTMELATMRENVSTVEENARSEHLAVTKRAEMARSIAKELEERVHDERARAEQAETQAKYDRQSLLELKEELAQTRSALEQQQAAAGRTSGMASDTVIDVLRGVSNASEGLMDPHSDRERLDAILQRLPTADAELVRRMERTQRAAAEQANVLLLEQRERTRDAERRCDEIMARFRRKTAEWENWRKWFDAMRSKRLSSGHSSVASPRASTPVLATAAEKEGPTVTIPVEEEQTQMHRRDEAVLPIPQASVASVIVGVHETTPLSKSAQMAETASEALRRRKRSNGSEVDADAIRLASDPYHKRHCALSTLTPTKKTTEPHAHDSHNDNHSDGNNDDNDDDDGDDNDDDGHSVHTAESSPTNRVSTIEQPPASSPFSAGSSVQETPSRRTPRHAITPHTLQRSARKTPAPKQRSPHTPAVTGVQADKDDIEEQSSDEIAGFVRASHLTSLDMHRHRSEGVTPKYRYQEVVRSKSERRQMLATTCVECEKFYRATGPLRPLPELGAPYSDGKRRPACQHLSDRLQQSSRHRVRYQRAPSPESFWEPDFPATQEIERARAARQQAPSSPRQP